MPTNNQLISIVIPIFNAEPYLEQCLDSILAQSYDNLEIICLNDGSTDNSLTLMQKYASQDSRIRIIDKQNQGYGATCNRGLAEATGEWISIIEPDDWIEPGMYAEMVSFANSLAEPLDIIKTPYWRIWMPDTPQQRKLNCSYRSRIKPKTQPFAISEAAHLLTHHPSIWSALYRKNFLDANTIRFREFPGAGWADNPFLIETLCQTNRIGYLDKPFYCYREETPEKAASFALSSPLLPLERWNDMMDMLEGLNVTDERIIRAHISRGFTYLAGVLEENSLDSNEALYKATVSMFERMSPQLVFSDPAISPGSKRLFAKMRSLPEPTISKLPYMQGLLKQGCYNLKNIGFLATWTLFKKYTHNKRSREGR